MKKILMIMNSTLGGAAHGSFRWLSALQHQNVFDVSWVASKGVVSDRGVIASEWPSLTGTFACRVLRRLCRCSTVVRKAEIRKNENEVLSVVRRTRPDAISLQNIHRYMSFGLVERLPKDIPIVWTLRDMWLLTGHCWYSMDCEKYLGGCPMPCPQKDEWWGLLRPTDREWQRRDRFIRENAHRLIIAAPSRWLAELAKKRFGGVVRVEWIPNTVETDIFRPIQDRAAVRRSLELPEDERIVMASAVSLDEPRKGIRYLFEALDSIRNQGRPVRLLLVGATHAGAPTYGVTCVGSIRDKALLNLYYNAADVFVLPSLADNMPNTLVEALAAGTPSVVFDVGGCPEVVRDGETGFVARAGDVDSLRDCLLKVISQESGAPLEMRIRCRGVAETEYALHLQGKRYAELFSELL